MFLASWLARRIFVMGEGDWGDLLWKLHQERAREKDYMYMALSYPPMLLLLLTNFIWTYYIVRAVFVRARRVVWRG
jgi:hypothetical protein